jgi:mercuric ion binding protein
MKRGLIFLSVFLCFVVISGGLKVYASKEIGNTKEVLLEVEGMTCKMCPVTIKTALKRIDGVVDARVSFKDKKAWVWYREDKVGVEEIVKAIESAGDYKAIPVGGKEGMKNE